MKTLVFVLSVISYCSFSVAVMNLPAVPSAEAWRWFTLASFAPLALLAMFLLREPSFLWTEISKFEGRFARIKLVFLIVLPSIVMAGISDWLQFKFMGFSANLVYSSIGKIGFQYVYFPILSLVSFSCAALLFSSFPVRNVAKKTVFVKTNRRTLYELLESTMFLVFLLTTLSDLSHLLGFEPPPVSPFAIPFTPTMWIEYLTLSLLVLPFYMLACFAHSKLNSISLKRIVASWIPIVISLAIFVTTQGARFALSQIWIFGTICVYWGIATAVNIVTRRH